MARYGVSHTDVIVAQSKKKFCKYGPSPPVQRSQYDICQAMQEVPGRSIGRPLWKDSVLRTEYGVQGDAHSMPDSFSRLAAWHGPSLPA